MCRGVAWVLAGGWEEGLGVGKVRSHQHLPPATLWLLALSLTQEAPEELGKNVACLGQREVAVPTTQTSLTTEARWKTVPGPELPGPLLWGTTSRL